MAGNNVPKFEDTTPVWEETSAVEEAPSELKTKSKNIEPYENFGSDILETGKDIISGIGTALDYPIAPFRSALAGENPIIPLFKGPSAAPTTEQLIEKIPGVKGESVTLPKIEYNVPDFKTSPKSIEDLKKQLEFPTEEVSLAQTLAPFADIGIGLGAGELYGLAAKGVGAGVKGAAKLVVPEKMQQAFQKGTEGTILNKDYLEKVTQQQIEKGKELAEPIIAKQAEQRVINMQNINNLENEIIAEKNKLQEAVDLNDNNAIKTHQSKIDQLESDIFGLKAQHKDELNSQKIANDNKITDLKKQIDIENEKLNTAVKSKKEEAQKIHQGKINQLESDIFSLKAESNDILSSQEKLLNLEKNKNITTIDKQLKDATQEFEKTNALESEKQLAANKKEALKIEHEKLNLADRIQNRLKDVRSTLQNQYDQVDNQLAKSNFKLDTKPIVQNFEEELSGLGITDPKTVEAITKNLRLYYGDDSINGFNNLKKSFNKLFEHADPRIGRLAKIGYGDLRKLQYSELEKFDPNLAKTLSDTNKRWSSMYNLEDVLSPIQKDNLDISKTLKAIESEEGQAAEKLAKQRQLRQVFSQFDPEQSEALISQMEEMAKRTQAAKEFKPTISTELPENILELENKLKQAKAQKVEIPEFTDYPTYVKQRELEKLKAAGPSIEAIPESQKAIQLQNELQKALEFKTPEYTSYPLYLKERELEKVKSAIPQKSLPPTSPELEKLQNLLKEYKQKGVENVPGLERFDLSSPEKIQEQIRDLVTKVGQPTGEAGSKQKIDELLQYIEKTQGSKAAEAARKSMGEIAENKALAKAAAGESKIEGGVSVESLLKNILGGTLKTTSKLGKATTAIPTIEHKNLLVTGARTLANATTDETQQLIGQLKSFGPVGETYAKMLSDSTQKNKISRDATIYSLMQQKDFRKMYNQIKGIKDEDTGE